MAQISHLRDNRVLSYPYFSSAILLHVLSAFSQLQLWNEKLVNLPTGIFLAFGFFLPLGSGHWDCRTEVMQKHLDNKAHAQLTLLSLLIHLNLDAATVVLHKLASRPSASDLKKI